VGGAASLLASFRRRRRCFPCLSLRTRYQRLLRYTVQQTAHLERFGGDLYAPTELDQPTKRERKRRSRKFSKRTSANTP
jgi:hypothetical protein